MQEGQETQNMVISKKSMLQNIIITLWKTKDKTKQTHKQNNQRPKLRDNKSNHYRFLIRNHGSQKEVEYHFLSSERINNI